MNLFNGKEQGNLLDDKIKNYISSTESHYIDSFVLGIVLIGNNKVSKKYANLKIKKCKELGVSCELIEIDQDLPDNEIESQIKKIYKNTKYKGIIVQLPLPRESLNYLIDNIPQDKDVDVLSNVSRTNFSNGDSIFLPPVVRSLMNFLDYYGLKRRRYKVTIVGDGFLVGNMINKWYIHKNMKINVIRDYQKGEYIDSKVVILATGNPSLVDPEDICPGAYVVDFGTATTKGKLGGDLDMTKSLDHLEAVSPSPGGMGPLVVRYLIMNHLGI